MRQLPRKMAQDGLGPLGERDIVPPNLRSGLFSFQSGFQRGLIISKADEAYSPIC